MKRAAAQVGAAAVVVAIAGYVAQFVAARWLGPADYTRFAVFWAVLFVIVGTLSGVAQEVIRVSRIAKLGVDAGLGAAPSDSGNPRIGMVAIAICAATTIAVLLTGPIWGPPVFGSTWPAAVSLLALGSALFGGVLTAVGAVAGQAHWRSYSGLVIVEGIGRIAVFVAATLLAPTVLGFSIAAVAAFLPGLLVALLWKPLRELSFAIRSDVGSAESVTRMLRAMGASGLSGVLVIGWPALLSAAANANPRGATALSLGILILLVTLTRAPLMVPLTAFQNVLVARFTGYDLPSRRRFVLIGTGVISAASLVLAALGGLVGPPLLPLVFGAEYQTDAGVVAALTAATAGLGIVTLTGVAAITSARHSVYLLGWGTAIVAVLLILFLAPVPFEWATVLALILGPLAGATVQLLALRTPSKSRTRSVMSSPSADG